MAYLRCLKNSLQIAILDLGVTENSQVKLHYVMYAYHLARLIIMRASFSVCVKEKPC